MTSITIGTRRADGNCYNGNAVVDLDSYSEEEKEILLDGGEIPSEWDENGDPIAWDYLDSEEEGEE